MSGGEKRLVARAVGQHALVTLHAPGGEGSSPPHRPAAPEPGLSICSSSQKVGCPRRRFESSRVPYVSSLEHTL